VNQPALLQGRHLGAAELAQVRQRLAEQPHANRRQLSRHLAQRCQWRTPTASPRPGNGWTCGTPTNTSGQSPTTAAAAQKELAQQPFGSGAIEPACRQYQVGFKRTGQFWTAAGDQAVLRRETSWRNGRRAELYPHAQPAVAALN
jgi:hypothetical protein